MLISDLFKTASKGVTVNKSRSLLTMLGIIIGVGAVVLMTGIGKSMEGVILGQISIIGPDTMVIMPGSQGPEGGPASVKSSFDALKISDVTALKKLKTIDKIAPIIFVSGEAVYGRERAAPQITGAPPEYFGNHVLEATQGRLTDQSDEDSARNVVILGSDTANDLFFTENPIGKRIEVANRKFTVVGVLKPVGTQFFQNFDERIIMPFSTAKNIMGRNYVDMITFQRIDDFDVAKSDVEALLRQRHGINVPEDGSTDNDDFLVRTSAQAQDILGSVSLGLTIFITMVAGISLFVGGIGIMNIMLVVVSERTHEIGLRKAIGAKRMDILVQFLVEAVLLTIIGGVIGIICGIGFSFLIALITQKFLSVYSFAISYPSIGVALLMAVATGLIFGMYPANQASKLSPIEALRYE